MACATVMGQVDHMVQSASYKFIDNLEVLI